MRQFIQSVYPNDIDPLLFYQDADIEHAPLLAQYYTYLKANNFDAASSYLASVDLDYYGAWLLNTIENWLYTVEEHIDEVIGENPYLVIYSEKEPVGQYDDDCFCWTGKAQPYYIYFDMDTYYLNPIDDIWTDLYIGNESKRTIDVVIADEDGNRISLRNLYHLLHPTEEAGEGTTYDFSTVGEEAFVIPESGIYKIEAWGAQGGTEPQAGLTNPVTGEAFDTYLSDDHNVGGYAYGNIYLEQGTTLYINVGGQNGYNGGGYGTTIHYTHTGQYTSDWTPDNQDVFMVGSNGGGATHVALSSGQLHTFANNQDDLLLVAGGGGGDAFVCLTEYDDINYPSIYANYYRGGSGGGFIGSSGYYYGDAPIIFHIPSAGNPGYDLADDLYDSSSGYYFSGWGGTQTWGGENRGTNKSSATGSFGLGGSVVETGYYSPAGGGGGYYGGAASYAGSPSGGGSGWYNNSSLLNTQMAIGFYTDGWDYVEGFIYEKESDFENEIDPVTGENVYSDYNLYLGTTDNPAMLTGYFDDVYDGYEYAAGDGHVRLTLVSTAYEPTDQELIDMLVMTSSKPESATVEWASTASIEQPAATITGHFMGIPQLKVTFDKRVRGNYQPCEITDPDSFNQKFYMTNNGLVYSEDFWNHYPDDRAIFSEYEIPKALYMYKGATSQMISNADYQNEYSLTEYNGLEYISSDPSVLHISSHGNFTALSEGRVEVSLIPKADFVGTGYYESGYYNIHNHISVLELVNSNILTYEGYAPWESYLNPYAYRRDDVVFFDDYNICFVLEAFAKCENQIYNIITYQQCDTGYYTGIAFNLPIEWKIDQNVNIQTSEGGQLAHININDFNLEEYYDGGEFHVSVTIDGRKHTHQIYIAPAQLGASSYNCNIHLNAVGDSMALPVTIYGHDENYDTRIVEQPCFAVYYGDYNNRIVNVNRGGYFTAIREGTQVVRLFYRHDSYITCNVTVGAVNNEQNE